MAQTIYTSIKPCISSYNLYWSSSSISGSRHPLLHWQHQTATINSKLHLRMVKREISLYPDSQNQDNQSCIPIVFLIASSVELFKSIALFLGTNHSPTGLTVVTLVTLVGENLHGCTDNACGHSLLLCACNVWP